MSILQAEANEVLAFAVFSQFLEINVFRQQRKTMRCVIEYCEPLTSCKHQGIHTDRSQQYLYACDIKPSMQNNSDEMQYKHILFISNHVVLQKSLTIALLYIFVWKAHVMKHAK